MRREFKIAGGLFVAAALYISSVKRAAFCGYVEGFTEGLSIQIDHTIGG